MSVRARTSAVVLSSVSTAALAVSLVTSAWWVGPVAGERRVVSLGLLGASSCFEIGEKKCMHRSLMAISESFGMYGIATFAACSLVALMMLVLAYLGWNLSSTQRSVGRFTIPAVLGAAGCAAAFVLAKPTLAVQPMSYGLWLAGAGLGLAMIRSIAAATSDNYSVARRVTTAKVLPLSPPMVEPPLFEPAPVLQPPPRSNHALAFAPPPVESLAAPSPPPPVHTVHSANTPSLPRASRPSLPAPGFPPAPMMKRAGEGLGAGQVSKPSMPPAALPLPGLPPVLQSTPQPATTPAVAEVLIAPSSENYIPGASAVATSTTAPVAPIIPLVGPQKTVIPIPSLPTVATQEVPLTRSRPDITKPPIRREQVAAVEAPAPLTVSTPLAPSTPELTAEPENLAATDSSLTSKSRDETVFDERAQTVATMQPVESFILQRSDTPVDDRPITDPVPPTDTSQLN
jgi:hypothetical protein